MGYDVKVIIDAFTNGRRNVNSFNYKHGICISEVCPELQTINKKLLQIGSLTAHSMRLMERTKVKA